MSSIITSILSSTLGLFWDKARDATAKSLQDGDITDAKIREKVVRELNDIKTKLSGLSREKLLASNRHLKEGFLLLIECLDKSKDEQKAVMNEDKDDGSATSSTMPSGGDILNDALQLSQAMEKLKIASNQFEFAKERFKDARKQATLAFCNEALSIEDRIFAAKLRVVSEILEYLSSPNTAVVGCFSLLEELHDLPAVREIFSVYLGGGVKSIFGKTERLENVKSIMMINYVLYQFILKFSNKYYSALEWTTIQLSNATFNPILSWRDVSMQTSWGDDFKQRPNEVEIDEKTYRKETVREETDGVRNTSKKEKSEPVPLPPVLWSQDEDVNKMSQEIVDIAIDKKENGYLIVRYYKGTKEIGYEVLFYASVDEKHEERVNFPSRPRHGQVLLAVDNENNIIITDEDVVITEENSLNSTGHLEHHFELKCSPHFFHVSESSELIIASNIDKTVKIYTKEGNLKKTLELPADHEVYGVAFHFGVNKIIVLSECREKDSCFNHRCARTCQQLTSTCLGNTSYYVSNNIKSHPSVPTAVLTRKAILYL